MNEEHVGKAHLDKNTITSLWQHDAMTLPCTQGDFTLTRKKIRVQMVLTTYPYYWKELSIKHTLPLAIIFHHCSLRQKTNVGTRGNVSCNIRLARKIFNTLPLGVITAQKALSLAPRTLKLLVFMLMLFTTRKVQESREIGTLLDKNK